MLFYSLFRLTLNAVVMSVLRRVEWRKFIPGSMHRGDFEKKGLGWGWEFGDPNDKKAASELSILASTWKRGKREVVNTTVTGSKSTQPFVSGNNVIKRR